MAETSTVGNFPPAAILETGDLLFPRARDLKVPLFMPPSTHLMSVDAQDDAGSGWPASSSDSELSSEWERDIFGVTETPENQSKIAVSTKSLLNNLFPDVANALNGLSLADFLAHPLVKLFLGAFSQEFSDNLQMGDGTLGSYYIGHVAMVIREQNQVYVIEANASDFSHYRVALHLYQDPATAGGPLELRRGWVDRRIGKHQLVWASRHQLLDNSSTQSDDIGRASLRYQLAESGKKYLGRPYGMFDTVKFGDDDRLYCGEFCFRAYRDAFAGTPLANQANLDDNRSWDWLAHNLGIPLPAALRQLLIDRYGEFPWLPVKMLNTSKRLIAVHKPGGDDYA